MIKMQNIGSNHYRVHKEFNGLPPAWATDIPTTFPDITAFDAWTYTTPITNTISNVVVKYGSTLPAWITITNTSSSVTLSGTPDNLSYIGSASFTLTAINNCGYTDQNFSINIINGDLPSWNSTTLSAASVIVFDTYNGSATVTVPVKGPLTSVTETSLPTWATVSYSSSTVSVIGTPNNLNQIQTSTFTLTAINKYGSSNQDFSIEVKNGDVPAWNSSTFSPTSVIIFDSYSGSTTLTVPPKGPLSNVVVKSGTSLPAWATLSYSNSAVSIVGTPSDFDQILTTTFTLTASNKYGSSTDQDFSIEVDNGPLPIWDSRYLSPEATTVFYNLDSRTNVTSPVAITNVTHDSNFPSWASLSYSGNGIIDVSGTPNSINDIGTKTFVLIASNKYGSTSHDSEIIVNSTPIPIWRNSDLSSKSVILSNDYSGYDELIVPNDGPLTSVSVKSGSSLPSWASLSWTGTTVTISGTPNGVSNLGTSTFTLVAANVHGNADHIFDISVKPGVVPVWSSNTILPSSTIRLDPYVGTASVTLPSDGPITSVVVKSGSMPSWSSLSYSGTNVIISGTPSNISDVKTSTFALSTINRYGPSLNHTFNITVIDGVSPVWASDIFSSGLLSVPYSSTVNITSPSNAPLTSVSVVSGSLPSWATLSYNTTSATIAGNTPVGGTSTFTLSATNKYGSTNKAFTLTISSSFLTHFDNFGNSLPYTYIPNLHQVWSGFTKFGTGCSQFNGVSSYLTVPASSLFAPGNGDFTIDAWIRPKLNNSSLIWSQTDTGKDYFIFGIDSSGNVFFGSNPDGTATYINGPAPITVYDWYHVAAVRYNGNVTVYVNGIGGSSVSNTTNLNNTTYIPTIGKRTEASSLYFNGYIDELRYSTIAQWTSNFTLPTTSYSDVSNTSLLLHFNQALTDSSLNNINVTNNNTLLTPLPKFGTACARFNGTGSSISNSTSYPAFVGNITVECWVYVSDFTSDFYIFDNRLSDTDTNGFSIVVSNTTGKIFMYTGSSGNYTSTAMPINSWVHVAFTKNNTDCRIYINGALKATFQNNVNFSDATNIVMGNNWKYTVPSNGFIDDMRISNVARYTTSSFAVPTAILPSDGNTWFLNRFDILNNDVSSNAVQMTFSGKSYAYSKILVSGGQVAAAKFSDGNYLTGETGKPQYKFPGAFTIEAWVFFTPLDKVSNNMIFDCGIIAPNNGGFMIYLSPTGVVGVNTNPSSGGTPWGLTSPAGSVYTNSWVHIAVVRNTSNLISIYVNGTSVASATNSSNFSNGACSIGRRMDTTVRWFNGYMTEFRISNSARYTAAFTPSTTQFTKDSNTNLLLHLSNGNITTDSSDNNLVITNNATTYQPSYNRAGVICPTAKFGIGAAFFDGTSGYIYGMPGSWSRFSGDFTVDCWINPILSNGCIFDTRANNTDSANGICLNMTTDNKLYIYTTTTIYTSTRTISLNTWTHIAIVRVGSTITLYINGTSDGTFTLSTNLSDGYLYFGKSSTPSTVYFGFIDEFRIINSVAAWTGNFTPPTTAY